MTLNATHLLDDSTIHFPNIFANNSLSSSKTNKANKTIPREKGAKIHFGRIKTGLKQ